MKALNSAILNLAVAALFLIKRANAGRILQTTGVAALVSAGFVFVSMVHGAHNDQRAAKLLGSPGIVEQFKAMERGRARAARGQVSPLMKQAEAFALHLNPKPETPKRARPSQIEVAQSRIPLGKPNLKVLGTSFCGGYPGMSLALIEEPGKGRRWFRQAGRVGEFLIEQIRDGFVIVKNDEKTFELVLEQGSESSLRKEVVPVSAKAIDQTHQGYSLSTSDKTAYIAPRSAGEISAPTKYNILEPMWGEDGMSARVLSYASSAK